MKKDDVIDYVAIGLGIAWALSAIGLIVCLGLPMPKWAWLGYTFLYSFVAIFLIMMILIAYQTTKD